jgi:hypothetical protein
MILHPLLFPLLRPLGFFFHSLLSPLGRMAEPGPAGPPVLGWAGRKAGTLLQRLVALRPVHQVEVAHFILAGRPDFDLTALVIADGATSGQHVTLKNQNQLWLVNLCIF